METAIYVGIILAVGFLSSLATSRRYEAQIRSLMEIAEERRRIIALQASLREKVEYELRSLIQSIYWEGDEFTSDKAKAEEEGRLFDSEEHLELWREYAKEKEEKIRSYARHVRERIKRPLSELEKRMIEDHENFEVK